MSRQAQKTFAKVLEGCAKLVGKDEAGATRRQCWYLASLMIEDGVSSSTYEGKPLSKTMASDSIKSYIAKAKATEAKPKAHRLNGEPKVSDAVAA